MVGPNIMKKITGNDFYGEVITLKKHGKFLAVLIALAVILPGLTRASLAADEEILVRLEGRTRVETSVAVSQEAYPEGTSNVVLAGYNGEIDALTGTLLANAKDAPLILSNTDFVPDVVLAELIRLDAKNIFILGGSSVVSEEVTRQLEGLDYTVTRIAGSDRDETAAEVAKEVKGTSASHVFLVQGYSEILADALVVGPASAKENSPVLLTKTDEIPATTQATMDELGVNSVTIIGGTSVVSSNLENQLKAKYTTVDRVYGRDREATAVAIAEKYFSESKLAIVASGYVYADALVGGYLGAKEDAPILLTNLNTVKLVTTDYIINNISKVWLLGGNTAISETVESEIVNAIDDTVPPKVIGVINGVNSVTVKFSEPLKTLGTLTANGAAWDYTFSNGKRSIEVGGLTVGESYVLKISGAQDRSGNYISPDPTFLNVNIKK